MWEERNRERMHQILRFAIESSSQLLQDKYKKLKQKKKAGTTDNVTLYICSHFGILSIHSPLNVQGAASPPHSSGIAHPSQLPGSPVMGSDSHIWLTNQLPRHKDPGQGRSCLLAPPKGALEICKLLQLPLPTQISLPVLTTLQTSCLCFINKLLYLFREVNLQLL